MRASPAAGKSHPGRFVLPPALVPPPRTGHCAAPNPLSARSGHAPRSVPAPAQPWRRRDGFGHRYGHRGDSLGSVGGFSGALGAKRAQLQRSRLSLLAAGLGAPASGAASGVLSGNSFGVCAAKVARQPCDSALLPVRQRDSKMTPEELADLSEKGKMGALRRRNLESITSLLAKADFCILLGRMCGVKTSFGSGL